MKKRTLINNELEEIINLRKQGWNWLKIQNKTNIPRRIAKRNYDEWEGKQSERQLSEVRGEVVAQEYRMHLDLLSNMAGYLIDSLVIPKPMSEICSADMIINEVMAFDYYQNFPFLAVSLKGQNREQRLSRMNQLLFKSLQSHTRTTVPWKELDEWKRARDESIKDICKIKEEAKTVFTNYFNQKNESKLKVMLATSGRNSQTIESISNGITTYIWFNDILRQPSEIVAKQGTSLSNKGTAWVEFHKSIGDERIITFHQTEKDQAVELSKMVRDVAKQSVDNLSITSASAIIDIKYQINKMHECVVKLDEKLNPLSLRPVLLGTKCDICPV